MLLQCYLHWAKQQRNNRVHASDARKNRSIGEGRRTSAFFTSAKGNPFAGRCCTRSVFTLEMVPVGLLNKNTIEKTTTSIAHHHLDVYSTPQEWHGGVHLETKVHCQSGFRTILLECTTAFFFRLKQVFILREPVIFPSRSAIRMFSAAIFESFFLLLMPALPSFFNIG